MQTTWSDLIGWGILLGCIAAMLMPPFFWWARDRSGKRRWWRN